MSGSRLSALRRLICPRSSQALGHVGFNEARGNRIDIDAMAADFTRERTGKSEHGRFGCTIDGETAVTGKSDYGCDVYDPAAPFRQHRTHDIFRQHDGGNGIDAHELLDLGIVHQRENTVGPNRGVIDQPVNGPEILANLFDQRGNGFDLTQIEGNEVEFALLRAGHHFNRRCEILVELARERDDTIPRARQLLGDAKAQPTTPAGDQDVTHSDAPFCRPMTDRAPEQSVSQPALCAAEASPGMRGESPA